MFFYGFSGLISFIVGIGIFLLLIWIIYLLVSRVIVRNNERGYWRTVLTIIGFSLLLLFLRWIGAYQILI